ncbi:transmembrane protein 255B-like [Asterias amurensis]|uniref:transmembrane protein 255B-like n=1 Tax=Asterias amurensis TaxID=7602 RepID=UPI003AB6C854
MDKMHTEAKKRRKIAAVCCIILILLSIIELAIGATTYQMVHNINAGSWWAAGGLLLGALLSLVGVYNKQEGRCWMAAGTAFLVIGIFLAFIGAIIDGVTASAVSRVNISKCNHSSSGLANCQVTAGCERSVSMLSTCYCCYVTTQREANCAFQSVGLSEIPSYFSGVNSCDVISGSYINLLWTSVSFLSLALLHGVVVGALVSGYKNLVAQIPRNYIPTPQSTPSRPAYQMTQSAYQPVVAVGPLQNVSPQDIRPIPAPRNRPPPYAPNAADV